MQSSQFYAQTDLEIGDRVETVFDIPLIGTIKKIKEKFNDELVERYMKQQVFTIYDIRTIHELRSGKVYFEFKIESEHGVILDWFKREQIIYPIEEVE